MTNPLQLHSLSLSLPLSSPPHSTLYLSPSTITTSLSHSLQHTLPQVTYFHSCHVGFALFGSARWLIEVRDAWLTLTAIVSPSVICNLYRSSVGVTRLVTPQMTIVNGGQRSIPPESRSTKQSTPSIHHSHHPLPCDLYSSGLWDPVCAVN